MEEETKIENEVVEETNQESEVGEVENEEVLPESEIPKEELE